MKSSSRVKFACAKPEIINYSDRKCGLQIVNLYKYITGFNFFAFFEFF